MQQSTFTRFLRTHLCLIALVATVQGCATHSFKQPAFTLDESLLDGVQVFGYPVAPAPEISLLTLSPEMQTFVGQDITGSDINFVRFRRLMKKLVDENYFEDSYDAAGTYPAAKTFALRRGNCLGYTNMFISLARAAGLSASYQLIDELPQWNVEAGYLVRNNHISVLLEDMSFSGYSNSQLTVDFNYVGADPFTPRTPITDTHAESLFYTNIAVDYLREGDHETAFAYLKRAILATPRNKDGWNNLGVLFSVVDQPLLAQRAYEKVLSLDPRNKTAIAGMARTLETLQMFAQAKVYRKAMKRYQQRNPFYHYAVAEYEYRRGFYEQALIAIERAIDLRRNNSRFYALLAATAQALGDETLAAKSRQRQAKYDKVEPRRISPHTLRVYAPS